MQLCRICFGGLWGAVLLAGCSGRLGPPEKPSLDADAAGQAAVETYDEDGNGKLDVQELGHCPSLLLTLPRADTDGDKALTADEISARITKWFADTIMMDASPLIMLDGKPLAGAEVVFEPEAFLGEGFKTCRGTTDESGRAAMFGPEEDHSGAYVGIYTVRVSKMEGGEETLPARYNSDSELGLEVAADIDDLYLLLQFELRSR